MPLCVTVTSCEATPVPVIVIVPILDDVVALAVKVAVRVPLLLPLAGVTVSHPALSVTAQVVFELMAKVLLPD